MSQSNPPHQAPSTTKHYTGIITALQYLGAQNANHSLEGTTTIAYKHFFSFSLTSVLKRLDYNKANYLLVGADNFKYMDKWYKADELIAKIKVVVYPRRGYDIRDSKYYDQAIILKEDLFDISSTDIRANLEDTKTSLHPKTYDLIMTKYKRYFQ